MKGQCSKPAGPMKDKPGQQVLEIKSRGWGSYMSDVYIKQDGVSRSLRWKLYVQSKRLADQDHCGAKDLLAKLRRS